jgi:hypothetical protein
MRNLLLATAAALALAVPAKALTITDANGVNYSTTASTDFLVVSPGIPPGNEPLNNPCIICASQQPGQPAGFGDNNYKQSGNETSFTEFSSATVGAKLDQNVSGTGYTLDALSPLLLYLIAHNAVNFNVGIDINTASNGEVLEQFAFINLTQHTILSMLSAPVPMPDQNNGSGFPDYTITGFNLQRGDIALGDTILFYARWDGQSDGGEQFFIVAAPQAVPGPLLGGGIPGIVAALGMLGLAGWRRRFRLS